jgi:hypothetical protein
MDAFRNFAKAKGVAYYGEALGNTFGTLFWIRGANTVASLTTMFVERLDFETHPELKVDAQGRDWPLLFRTLRGALKQSWMQQWTEQQQQPEFTAPTGADPLPDVDHPVYSEGDNLLHKLFLIPDLGSFIEEEQMFESFLKRAYGDEVTLLEAKERFQHGTMCVSDVSTGPNFFAKHNTVLELKDRLVNKFVLIWERDENSEGAATSGSEDKRGG